MDKVDRFKSSFLKQNVLTYFQFTTYFFNLITSEVRKLILMKTRLRELLIFIGIGHATQFVKPVVSNIFLLAYKKNENPHTH